MLSVRRTAPLPDEVPRPPAEAQICFRVRESGDMPACGQHLPSRRDDRRRFLNDTNDLRRLEIGNRLAIRHGDS